MTRMLLSLTPLARFEGRLRGEKEVISSLTASLRFRGALNVDEISAEKAFHKQSLLLRSPTMRSLISCSISSGLVTSDELEMQWWIRRCSGVETGPGRSEKQNSMQRSS
ncbi:uncharacterized protein LOC108857453 [Raphanus sativus]|uniref:Uncharacterized protein LOC108857453 n=1 Tax=Raphanus sativus TaxID=3726 RepID=A0A6J0NQA1_RAPSA|nr:uncharacterized protein LOC108857453 [Raphanus sativus]